MRRDGEIKHEAEQALRMDKQLDPTGIAVAVNRGVVLLSGYALNEEEKWRAARDVARVSGVAAIANDIEVRRANAGRVTDPQLARQAADHIRLMLPYSHRFIRIALTQGWLTLEGDVEWNYQKDRAETAGSLVKDITGITNALRVDRWVEPADVQRMLEEAIKRRAG